MPFRTKSLLEAWLSEFRAQGHDVSATVALQDGSDGSDTGLVILQLTFADTEVFMQPVALHDPRWAVTFQARSFDVALTPQQVDTLGREVIRVGQLCAFLEAKSQDYIHAHAH